MAVLLLIVALMANAQKFYNLTAQQVRIDSVAPSFSCAIPLCGAYTDSVYTVSIAYPEYIDMTAADIARYRQIMHNAAAPTTPTIEQHIVTTRRKASLEVSFCPVVRREGRYQLLVSFMLDVQSRQLSRSAHRRQRAAVIPIAERYAEQSVLASGRWAKIRVSESGVYQITESLIRSAGFNDISRIHVYGMGGALIDETLTGASLQAHDDLREVPLCLSNGKRLFYAQGPVSWSSNDADIRTRNPYSQYGYYFITQTDEEATPVDSATFIGAIYPSAKDYHWLHETDNYAWYNGGRNLVENTPIALNSAQSYTLSPFTASQQKARVTVTVTAGIESNVEILLGDSLLGTVNISPKTYDKGAATTATYSIERNEGSQQITLKTIAGGPVRLDYISMTFDAPAPAPLLSNNIPVPEYVCNITPQNHHADGQADMVIIIPTSQKLLTQAQRLKRLHEEHDSMRVTIVPADELYNEFSSGTPDASAYRHYLKMLYDRAKTENDIPRYLLLLGDCVWDNRMLTGDTRRLNADDYLLCYESENSFSELYSYVNDGFFTLMDDGEGSSLLRDKEDIAVGRMPVTTAEAAKGIIDKTENYMTNANAGAWQNVLMFMGDDGNQNIHMRDIDAAAEQVASLHPGYHIKKVMWDAYQRESSATGHTYPGATQDIKQQMANGALIMDYGGHGRAEQLSHEKVLTITDFEQSRTNNLPLWITASCDIMAFDGVEATLGETAICNAKGGAVAFWGTMRTVQTTYNKAINMAYLRHVLAVNNGRRTTIGEAQRLAKNEMITTGQDITTNKLQYALLGDPALALAVPTLTAVIDSINGKAVGEGTTRLQVGKVARIAGHIEQAADFNGVVTATIRDVRELITCRQNNEAEAQEAFTYYDRKRIIYNGADSVRGGKFAITFAVPKDISYSDGTGLINIYAVDNAKQREAHGAFDRFGVTGGDVVTDSVGPSVYCYLNSPHFTNGGKVNTTPYFVAEINDEDGINATGTGIGHDLLLTIDGDMTKTYTLNDNFSFDFGTYTRGTTYYNIPELEEGKHSLTFRAWDVLNNATTTHLDFTVVRGLEPNIFSVGLSKNPATTSTTFIVNHDRTGSQMDVDIEVFDMSGRLLWNHSESGVPTTGAYTIDWDLTTDNGGRLQTGVYLYRVKVGADGSKKTSKAKKLVVIGNN